MLVLLNETLCFGDHMGGAPLARQQEDAGQRVERPVIKSSRYAIQHRLSLMYAELKCPGPQESVPFRPSATVTASVYAGCLTVVVIAEG